MEEKLLRLLAPGSVANLTTSECRCRLISPRDSQRVLNCGRARPYVYVCLSFSFSLADVPRVFCELIISREPRARAHSSCVFQPDDGPLSRALTWVGSRTHVQGETLSESRESPLMQPLFSLFFSAHSSLSISLSLSEKKRNHRVGFWLRRNVKLMIYH